MLVRVIELHVVVDYLHAFTNRRFFNAPHNTLLATIISA